MNYNDFKKPNKKFAPSPFWAINDKLNTEETKRQMKDLIDRSINEANSFYEFLELMQKRQYEIRYDEHLYFKLC